MHNLAIALHNGGHIITGSDDQIFEPSRGRLALKGLLPEAEGWYSEKVHEGLDAIILGMHVRPLRKNYRTLSNRFANFAEQLLTTATTLP